MNNDIRKIMGTRIAKEDTFKVSNGMVIVTHSATRNNITTSIDSRLYLEDTFGIDRFLKDMGLVKPEKFNNTELLNVLRLYNTQIKTQDKNSTAIPDKFKHLDDTDKAIALELERKLKALKLKAKAKK